ncbi:phosphodiester glycosidase family protein [Deinococcus sp.]|uniref:phosphodiester glycosidase family protein n=1 Tax=Deinococcus sp. TaxID=47478 RepID=UPI003CC54A40
MRLTATAAVLGLILTASGAVIWLATIWPATRPPQVPPFQTQTISPAQPPPPQVPTVQTIPEALMPLPTPPYFPSRPPVPRLPAPRAKVAQGRRIGPPLPQLSGARVIPARPSPSPALPARLPARPPVLPDAVAQGGPPITTRIVALNQNVDVQMIRTQVGRTQLALIRGGLPVSRHVLWRSSVGQFMKAAGAVAGVNGTFFKDAAIASNDSNMLGPLLTADGTFWKETDAYLLSRITGRPLVAWSHDQFLVTAFRPLSMNRKADLLSLLPGMTDAFLAGTWLVRGGKAVSAADMKKYAPSDAQEVRPRVFFGVTTDGLGIAGATTTPVSSARLAQIAQQVGAQEAVLLDSGYSTSLIYGSQVLAVGHRSRKVQSRPVPHAIVFFNPRSVQAQGKPVAGR